MTVGVGMLSEDAIKKIKKSVGEILDTIWEEARKVAKENELPLTEQLRIQNQLVMGLLQTVMIEHMIRQRTYLTRLLALQGEGSSPQRGGGNDER